MKEIAQKGFGPSFLQGLDWVVVHDFVPVNGEFDENDTQIMMCTFKVNPTVFYVSGLKYLLLT